MKKHTASLMTAAMLLTVAWLTGCDSKELEQPAGTGTAPALETTAEPITEAATEAIEATEAAGQSFDDYAAFAAAMAEQYPEKTLYTPPESVLAAWTWKEIQQETVNLLISMEPLFQNAQEIVDSMADLTDVTATLVDAGCCLCQCCGPWSSPVDSRWSGCCRFPDSPAVYLLPWRRNSARFPGWRPPDGAWR